MAPRTAFQSGNVVANGSEPTLIESELRSLAKSLADALIYLRKELIVHADINPSNILLTSDYGVKLSNFKHSLYFSEGTTANTQSKIMQTIDRLSENLSHDVKALISRTLQLVPENRIYVPDILSHAFLASDMPVKSLRPTASVRGIPYQISHGELFAVSNDHQPDTPSSFRLASRTVRHVSDHLPQTLHNRARLALTDIGNIDWGTALYKDITSCKATRRVVSDPARRTTVLSPFQTLKSYCETPTPTVTLRGNITEPALRTYTRSRSELETSEATSHKTADTVSKIAHWDKRDDIQENVHKKVNEEKPDDVKLPIGTERPTPFNTQTMTCQTHKTIYGQITVLPSRSLLVDFRESQRRKGFKGDEVLLIDPNGLKVSIISKSAFVPSKGSVTLQGLCL
ncbi:hypothetical protein C0995_004671 [Termitomyces sp. Mi166|nr:hypothetical protein C0995_004671 [Termitomyces sp. Mi166\